MSNLLITLAMTTVIIFAAVAMLGISWLLTGKSNLRTGACGRDPSKKRKDNEDCNTGGSCDLCEGEERNQR